MADVDATRELVGSASRDLQSALEVNAMLRARLEASRAQLEEVARDARRAAELREEAQGLERRVLDRSHDLVGDLVRIGAALEEMDASIARGGHALREAASSARDHPPEVAASLQAALAGVDALTALSTRSRDGIDDARRAVLTASEQISPHALPGDTVRPLRAASEDLAAADRQATQRAATTEATLHHSMTLAAMLPTTPATTDLGRRPEHHDLTRPPTPASTRNRPHEGLRM